MQPMEPRLGRAVINAYGDGGFRINGAILTGPTLIFPSGVFSWGGDVETFDEAAFHPVLERLREIDLLLIGCGFGLRPLPPAVLERLRAASLGFEVMTTSAACRTYSVLLAEDRLIGAALSPV